MVLPPQWLSFECVEEVCFGFSIGFGQAGSMSPGAGVLVGAF
jgi:hypothetical protein